MNFDFLSNVNELMIVVTVGILILTVLFMAFTKKLTYAVGAFALYGVLLGVIFMFLGTPLLAAVQVLVFSGTISVLMLAIISLERGDVIVEIPKT